MYTETVTEFRGNQQTRSPRVRSCPNISEENLVQVPDSLPETDTVEALDDDSEKNRMKEVYVDVEPSAGIQFPRASPKARDSFGLDNETCGDQR